MGLEYVKLPKSEKTILKEKALKDVNLSPDLLNSKIYTLSGGENNKELLLQKYYLNLRN